MGRTRIEGVREQENEVTRGRINIHEKKLNKFYSLPNIIKAMKSRRTRWVGHVACNEKCLKIFVGNSEGK
jgi:hypothetical protein